MLDPQWRILLVQVSADITVSLRAALADRAELMHLSAAAAVEVVEAGRSEGPAAAGRPTLAILGPDVPAVVGLVHALRPDPKDLATLLLTAPGLADSADKGTADPAAVLSLLVSPELARTLPCDQVSRLPQLAAAMLEQLDRERSYAASRAAARRGFAGQIRRQPGEYLFGSYLTQALISELLVRQDRLLHQLSATTDALQGPLLPPSLPTLPGLDLAGRYQPSGDGLHIGGDFYDAFPVSAGRWVLVLGDVCGKGPAAAAITGLVRHSLWAAAQQDPDAAHVLPLVNRALIRDEGPYCTLVYAVVDPTRTPVRLQLVRAGHPAPLLRRADGTTSVLLTDSDFGLMLGAFDDVQHPVQQISLYPGDSLVLYTDGFTEGASCYKQRDSEDLAAILAACPVSTGGHPASRPAGWAADLIAETLMEDACVWWSEQLRDDLAVLALTALHSGSAVSASRAGIGGRA